jgi:hypothetical protein
MNPPLKTTGLFLTPRGPYGRRLPERARKHLRASEDEPKLPDEDRKGHWQGTASFDSDGHGKPGFGFKGQYNSNSDAQETANYTDLLWEQREKDRAKEEELKQMKKKEDERKQRATAQQPQKPSPWRFTAPPVSVQKAPGLF